MMNYGLPIEEQKFKRTEIPKSLEKYKAVLTTAELDFIKGEYHKRHNGIWVIIKDIDVYIPGPYYHFLTYHVKEDSNHPDFRYIQCLFYCFWDMVVRDLDVYGCFLVGPRRAGKTEFTLGIIEEYASRVKSTRSGMQSKNDTAALENFKRITYSNKNMIWFMKPVSRGSDDPNDKLEYKYPMQMSTSRGVKDRAARGQEEDSAYSEEEMGSWIDFQPSIEGAYDRTELNRWILNEAGKLIKMSLLGCWDKVKSCLHYKAGKQIVGKAIFETTIEEVTDDQIKEVIKLYQDSNPLERNANNRTISGLISLFLSHHDCYDEDEWGFSKREEAELFLNNEIEFLKKKGDFAGVAALLRKNPRTIEDALTPSGDQSAFNKERLQDILKRLEFPEVFGYEDVNHTMRGNFIWAGGQMDTKVIFIPDEENGKFNVSQLLKDGEDNAQVNIGGTRYPTNVHRFRGGVDPYEHSEVVDKARASKGAGVIIRMYDDNEDGAKMNEGTPMDFAWEWKSKQPVCDYCYREDDPDLFFEDMLMMHVYYGTQMNVENNKMSIKKHFKQRGYHEYVMQRPESTMDPTSRYGKVLQFGTPATEDTVQQYFNAIATYVMNYSCAIKHKEIVMDLLVTNKGNRTFHDLSVALGWALIACEKKYYRAPVAEVTVENEDWFQYNQLN